VFGIFFLFFNILKLAFPREILSAFLWIRKVSFISLFLNKQ
jgi:hypothetical protein